MLELIYLENLLCKTVQYTKVVDNGVVHNLVKFGCVVKVYEKEMR
jgi:tRNA splicing endonuclease